MSRGSYHGYVEVEGYFTINIEYGKFYMEDFWIDSTLAHSYDDVDIDVDRSDLDWIDEYYEDFFKAAKKALAEQGIEITEDTCAFAYFNFTAETDYKGSWDDGYWYNSDHFDLPDSEFIVGEDYFDFDVEFVKIEYDEDE